MKKSYAIIVVLLTFWGVNKADVGCMYGWRLSSDRNWCEISCKDPLASDNRWNIYCKSVPTARHAIRYNSTTDALITARGRSLSSSVSKLPSCFNVTLEKGAFTLNQNGVISAGNYYFLPTSNIYDSHDGALSVCYPLSPQLLQCDLQETSPDQYHVKDGVEIVIPCKNFSAYLGDFYINQEKIAFTCAETIRRPLYGALRCNYVYLNSGNYVILKNGSMFISGAKLTIANPVYSVEFGSVTRVCIPLSFDLLNCRRNLTESLSYVFTRDMSVAAGNALDSFPPNDCFVDANGKLNYCSASSDAVFSSVSVVIYIYLIVCIAASLVILATVVAVLLKCRRLMTNNHTLCMFFHVGFLLLVYVAFMINRFYMKKDGWPCYLLFSFNYFSNISTMTWLNVVLFDLWQNFYRLHYHNDACAMCVFVKFSKTSRFLFVMYSIYAFGLTAALLTVILAVDLNSHLCEMTFGICPHIGRTCWFNNVDTYLVFYATPYTILTMINLLFLVLTIHVLQRATCDTKVANPLCKTQMRRVIVKLLVLSCFCYVVTTVSFVVDAVNTSYFIYSTLIYDAVMIGQGIAIFVIYYLKHLHRNIFK